MNTESTIFSPKSPGLQIPQTLTIIKLLCALFFVAPLAAQVAQFPEFQFEALTMEDGLNFRDVVAIDQDAEGMMWFGTTQGLIRYDGYNFKLYNSDPNNPFYIPEEAIGVAGIACAESDQLWFLAFSQLFLLNTTTDEIQSFGTDHGINGDVSRLLLDEDHHLWIITDNYYSNRGSSQQAQQFLLRQVRPDSFTIVHTVPRLQSGMTSITQGSDQSIWWSTMSRGQLGFSKDAVLIKSIRPDSAVVSGEKTFPGISFFASNGEMYLLSSQNVRKLAQQDGHFQTVYQPDEFVYCALEDRNHNIWLGSERSIYLRTPEGEFQNMTPVIRENLAFGETHQFFLDQQNIVWIGTDFGLLKVRSQDQLFDQFLNRDGNTLSSPMRGFAEAEDGTIIVMNENERRLYKISPNDKVTPIDLLCDTGSGVASILNAARFFVTDQSYRYAYTANKYLVQIDLVNNNCFVDTSISPYPDVHNLNPMEILSDGRLVAGHTLGTIQIYDPKSRTSERLLADGHVIPVIENVRFLLEGKEPGILWVGTHENGVFKLKIGGDIIDHLSINSDPVLTKNAILVIHEDTDTSLWIGTFGGGIDHYIPRNREMQHYDVDDGLPDNNVVGILPDADSILWISTYNGLSRFDKRTRSFQNFYIEDGLTHNEFNYASYHKDRKGRFYFGGMNGFVRFSPDAHLPKEQTYPAPRFTSLTRHDRRLNETLETDLIQHSLEELTISPYDTYFQIHWTVANYFNSQENRYYVKMEGLDADWTFLENRPFVRFNRLDPGNYFLRVRATDFRGNEAESELTLPIHVGRIFYKTWWFIALCVVAISALIYAFFQYRLQRLLEIEKLRTRISSDLHDDLGSMLSGLAMQSEILEVHAREEDKPRLQKIASTSRTAVHRMRDLVWSIDARKDKVSDLIDKMQETAEDLLPKAGFTYVFHAEELQNRRKKLNVHVRQNLFLIFKEAITNIIKHSNGNNVVIRLHKTGHGVQLVVRDNGTEHQTKSNGAHVTKTGQGLMNMKMRVEHLKGNLQLDQEKGFEIRVDIPANHIFM